MNNLTKDEIRESVRSSYKKIALSSNSCCSKSENSKNLEKLTKSMGYDTNALKDIPIGANMGLGCGNPHAIASLKDGDVVLDLGSGGGLDCFLASKSIGSDGLAIGVDMTSEMIFKARENAKKGNYSNVDFRLGEIENLPVADSVVDVIISNCVINLSLDKQRVFNEAFRVLKLGGVLAISDIVLSAKLPQEIIKDLSNYSSCVSGAVSIHNLESMLEKSRFSEIKIEPKEQSKKFIRDWVPNSKIEDYIISAYIYAKKKC